MRFCLIILGVAVVGAGSAPAVTAERQNGRVSSVVRIDARTGRLVRTIVAPPAAPENSGKPPAEVHEIIVEKAKEHDLDPLLIHSMIQVESNYNAYATSPKGAQGIMQLIPATARRFGVSNSYDVRDNISGGVRYLRFLMDLFQNEKLAVAAYNAGEEAVIRYGGVPPYRETQNYVRLVGDRYREAKRTEAPEVAKADSSEQPDAVTYRPIEEFVDAQGRLHIRTR